MSAIPNPPLLIANGSYDVAVTAGLAHLLTLKGTFGGATVTLTTLSNGVPGTFDSVKDGAWTADAETNLRPPSGTIRLTVTNATGTTAISASIIPHK